VPIELEFFKNYTLFLSYLAQKTPKTLSIFCKELATVDEFTGVRAWEVRN
jgi:hypothetical protein